VRIEQVSLLLYPNDILAAIGVTFCLVSRQLDEGTFEKGLADWRNKHPEEVIEDAVDE
jgi:magnesium-dependent phosphatase 1